MDHTIVHFEIPANNVEKLKKFYAKLSEMQKPLQMTQRRGAVAVERLAL
jgi:predicted enzyme related to lactoylglutathione lyase